MLIYRRMKVFMMAHWVKFAVITFLIALIGMAIWGLSSVESFYRRQMLAYMPIQLLMGGLHAVIFVFMYLHFFRGGFSKMDKKKVKSRDIAVKWSDVIGIDEAKIESWEVVELIKDRARLKKIGGKILRGVLMVGPPGCGKTYLAKAMATEAGIPFLPMAASEFVEVFVGVGASRIRKLFKEARQLAYAYNACIIFIDELDAIGRNRTFNMFGGQEGNTTQNQLLIEMDGLNSHAQNVIVIAATNAEESVLDPALLRPGRFDRKIYIDRPNLEGREKIFKFYLKSVCYDEKIDIGRLARQAVYKSPADIENIVKESALIATRNKRDIITQKDISAAIERIEMGLKHHRKMTDAERRLVAYHEAGHLLVLYLLHPTDDVFKASIISRKDTLGVVHRQPREETFTRNRDRIIADIKVALGSYAAERFKIGVTSDGVSGDFQQAMGQAHTMVWKYGMGSNGLIGDYTIIKPEQLSEVTKEKLNSETNKILETALSEVTVLLKTEEKLLDRLASELLERNELEYDEIEKIFAEFGKSNKALK